MTHSPSATSATGTLDISLRESRMVLDRLLMQTGMPYGAIASVRECVLVSEALGLGGLRRFDRLQPVLGASTTEPLRLQEAAGTPLTVDAAGQHAWSIAQILIDLLIAESATGGATKLAVRNVTEADELAVIPSLAARLGAEVSVHTEPGTSTCTLVLEHHAAPPHDHTDAVLWRIIREGLVVEAPLWWQLYQRSMGALAPDSVVSRRHAGANIVDDSGKVIGRMTDDDTDFSLLRAPGARAQITTTLTSTSTESPS
jgi:hypothetical protein